MKKKKINCMKKNEKEDSGNGLSALKVLKLNRIEPNQTTKSCVKTVNFFPKKIIQMHKIALIEHVFFNNNLLYFFENLSN